MRRADTDAILRAVERVRAGATVKAATHAEGLAHYSTVARACHRLGVSVRGRGRPRVHSDETVTAVVACVRAGEPVERVARACGMGVRTLYTRMEEHRA